MDPCAGGSGVYGPYWSMADPLDRTFGRMDVEIPSHSPHGPICRCDYWSPAPSWREYIEVRLYCIGHIDNGCILWPCNDVSDHFRVLCTFFSCKYKNAYKIR